MLFLSILLFGNLIIGSILLVILMSRLLLLGCPKYTIMTVVLGGVFLVNVQLTKGSDKPVIGTDCCETIKVYPDMLINSGGQFRTTTISQATGRKTIYYGRFQSLNQKRQMIESSQPLLISIKGERKAIDSATNVNQFDMRDYDHHQKIYEEFFITDLTTVRLERQLSLIDRLHVLRANFDRYCQRLPKTLRIYAMGLISGNRESDFFTEMTGVQQLGLLHLFSISGMHVYYFLGILTQLFSLMGLGRKPQAIIKLGCLGGYFIFSGSSLGLLRAVIMAGLMIMAQFWGFKLSQLAALSLTLMINLLLFPEAMFMMSVQLSYGLAFGLIAAGNMGYFKQTVLLNLLSLPILLFHLYEWHILSLAVSLIVLPLFGKTIFPLVILGLGLGMIDRSLTLPIEGLLGLFNGCLNMIGQLPGMLVFGKPPLVITLLMLGLTVFIMIHSSKFCRVALVGLYLGTFIWIHYPFSGEVTMFDVGQGDSFLIRTPFNRSVTLIDTGGKVGFKRPKWQQGPKIYQASRLSINYLKSIGISKIDTICISHQDSDHCGDLPAFIKEMQIKRILIPMGMQENPNFIKRLAGKSPKTLLLPVNDESRIADLPLTVYHPYLPGKGENHDSEVLGGRLGGLNWLFTGDLDRSGELETLQRHPGLKTDVIKVGHHGSRTASDPSFISHICPQIALISAGRNNRYHHPNIETLETLRKAGVKILNTQQMGMVRYIYQNNTGHFESVLGCHKGKNR